MAQQNLSEPHPDALEKFSILFSYLQYENIVFWTRAGFFLLVHTALLGFLVTAFSSLQKVSSTVQAIVTLPAGLIGLVLAVTWLMTTKLGVSWINHWQTLLLHFEPEAFGDVLVLRGVIKARFWESAKRMVYVVAALYGLLWLLLVGYYAIVLVCRAA